MEDREIIRSINRIYDRFDIVPHLRLHMFRVAGVGEYVIDNWDSEGKPDKNRVVAELLIHDLGNIVKFDFKTKELWAGFTDSEKVRWKKSQDATIAKYGSDVDYVVTLAMAKEVGASEGILSILSTISEGTMDQVLESKDYGLQLCSYADHRVCPTGIVSLKERFADLRVRYKAKLGAEYRDVWNDSLGLRLEAGLLKNTALRPEEINDESVKPYIEKYSRL
jgi:hypothetical protein